MQLTELTKVKKAGTARFPDDLRQEYSVTIRSLLIFAAHGKGQ